MNAQVSSLELKMYEQVVNYSADGIFLISAEGTILFSNNTSLLRLGATFEELKDKIVYEFGKTYNTENQNWEQLYSRIKENKNILMVKSFRSKDDIDYTIEINMSHLVFNNLGCVVAICRDVSDRAKLKRKEAEFKMLKETSEFRQNFLNQISHEIRTPLNGILGLSDVLLNQNKKIVPSEEKELMTTIRESALQMSMLMDNFLEMSKLECGISTLTIHKIHLDQLLHRIATLFGPQAENKNLLIHKDIANSEYKILIDKSKLEQIVTNLVSNAIKYTNAGHITISSKLSLETETHSNIEICVEDTGIGIPIGEEHKLFQQYSRLNNINNNYTLESGTGVGLWLTNRLARDIGLEIIFSRCEHGGSKFSVKGKIKKAPLQKIEPLRTINIKKWKILLVDDNQVNLKVARLMLDNLEAKYDTAIHGQEALNLYRNAEYAIILLDIEMPVLNGYDTIKELKRRYSDLPPIIALTANNYLGYEEILLEKGFDGYLSKPLTIESLKNILNKFLSE